MSMRMRPVKMLFFQLLTPLVDCCDRKLPQERLSVSFLFFPPLTLFCSVPGVTLLRSLVDMHEENMHAAHHHLIERLDPVAPELCQNYNLCVLSLVEIWKYSLNTVTKYISLCPDQHTSLPSCPIQYIYTEG